MTTTPDRSTEIAAYLAAVDRHLSDLPDPIRDDLMSDLDSHLAEVAADLAPGTSLSDLLGGPEAYARELRETAETAKVPAADRVRRRLRETAAPVLARAKAAADGFAASSGHADAAELGERLRPGWWAVRGAVAALILLYWISSAQYGYTDYWVFGSLPGMIFGVATVLLGVWVSLRIGAASRDWGRRRRRWTAWIGAGIVVIAAYQFSWVYTGALPNRYVPTSSYDGASDGSYVSDVRAYDENGEPIEDFYLFDQDGEPLFIGDPFNCPFSTDHEAAEEFDAPVPEGAEEEFGYLYPLCETPAEALAEETPTPAESESPSADATPTEGTATPTGAATPSDEPTASADPGTATPSESPK
ncbi:HAAS signaling domain-containing protein [Glycomyces albidus]|uniref:Uncharacterized protein n=1 Tax=Glycomyces albidus TaxID=2656774 RepID=A0A6L5GC18_9ACTN|nr:hypothetical protein [Glycomyces albidus]MQM27178.1 hypothetical protein [Glycomyces albidus]